MFLAGSHAHVSSAQRPHFYVVSISVLFFFLSIHFERHDNRVFQQATEVKHSLSRPGKNGKKKKREKRRIGM